MTRVSHLGHRKRLSRIFITLMVLIGWLVLSNHCALALFGNQPDQPSESTAHHCHAAVPDSEALSSAPEKTAGTTDCCYSLEVAVPDTAKPLLPDAETYMLLPLVWALMINAATDADTAPFLSTSPPERLISFPELVLQRCFPSLAPPRV